MPPDRNTHEDTHSFTLPLYCRYGIRTDLSLIPSLLSWCIPRLPPARLLSQCSLRVLVPPYHPYLSNYTSPHILSPIPFPHSHTLPKSFKHTLKITKPGRNKNNPQFQIRTPNEEVRVTPHPISNAAPSKFSYLTPPSPSSFVRQSSTSHSPLSFPIGYHRS